MSGQPDRLGSVVEHCARFSASARCQTPASTPGMSRIVITGGPGEGRPRSCWRCRLAASTIVDDSARAIIQDRRRRGLSPRPNAYEFAYDTLRIDIENFLHHVATPGHVFFDRSVLDALCMLDHVTPLNESELSMWLSKYQYHSKVFVLPPWQAILRERCRTRAHVRACRVGQQQRAGVVPAVPVSAHRSTQGFGCRALYFCAPGAGKQRRLTKRPAAQPREALARVPPP